MVWHKTIGNGPTKVIVIHGWFWDHRVFASIFDCLDTASHTYAFVDIRGYGNSRNVSGEYTISEVAADAIALADQLGWREFHVVGHSMGGKAAQKGGDGCRLTCQVGGGGHPGAGFCSAIR
jgi:pimeloyl-ACP methyl ester carboxylesterase